MLKMTHLDTFLVIMVRWLVADRCHPKGARCGRTKRSSRKTTYIRTTQLLDSKSRHRQSTAIDLLKSSFFSLFAYIIVSFQLVNGPYDNAAAVDRNASDRVCSTIQGSWMVRASYFLSIQTLIECSRIFLKLELLQPSGSFKSRYNATQRGSSGYSRQLTAHPGVSAT